MDYSENNSSILLPWQRKDKIDLLAYWLILLFLCLVLFFFFLYYSDSKEMYNELKNNNFGNFMIICSKALLFVNIAAIIWRLFLWRNYVPLKEGSFKDLPSVSIIIPSYNEEKSIYASIVSIVSSDYPKEKIQLVIIDDGSNDSTYAQMILAVEESKKHGILANIIHYKQNKGKRYALYQGFSCCMHEIIITIDSDSIVLPKTLRNLVAPFMHDKNTGAVAGNVKVMNHHKGIIPRMLDVSFNYSFDFIRAGQSCIDAVLVTPGALSAYRADLLHKVKDKWLNQHFLGVKVNIGEDRAMNNFIVSLGYRTVYQKNAQVFTNVPTNYANLCKMYLRWTRSNIRETILMSSFIFKPFRDSGIAGLRSIYCLHIISLSLPIILKIQIIMVTFINPWILLIQLIVGAMVVSIIPVLVYGINYKSRNALWGFLYSLFFLFSLWWITPYAMLTLRNNDWLTKK